MAHVYKTKEKKKEALQSNLLATKRKIQSTSPEEVGSIPALTSLPSGVPDRSPL